MKAITGDFALSGVGVKPVDMSTKDQREATLLGLRDMTENYCVQVQTSKSAMANIGNAEVNLEREVIALLIDIADKFEDAFRMWEGRRLWKPKPALDSFRTVYDVVCEKLEQYDVHKAPIEGKRFKEVEYNGYSIANPWKVVDVTATGKGSNDRANKVVRSLWVRVVNGKPVIVREGQVTY